MNKPTVFLSYSSKDHPNVERLAQELKNRGVKVWLDRWEIQVGDDIPTKVQKGLAESRFVAVWLTKHSASSEWVATEWHCKILQEIDERQVKVLPLLAETCDIPPFLSRKQRADFRTSFKAGISALMRSIHSHVHQEHEQNMEHDQVSIVDRTVRFLSDLAKAEIPLPTLGSLRLIRSLKAIPRSGKLLRLESMQPTVPIRSIYDHILSVAHSADQLLPIISDNLDALNRLDLARVIAYHDLCEAILGDIPQYTQLNRARRSKARIEAENKLSRLSKGEPERITNDFISMFLEQSESGSLKHAQAILSGKSLTQQIFYALDKIDPIIAIWRYVHILKKKKRFDIDEFLRRTAHFFENPQVIAAVTKSISDDRMKDFVRRLQDPASAKRYFYEAEVLNEKNFRFPAETVKCLIEGRGILFVHSRRKRYSMKATRGQQSEKQLQRNRKEG